MKIVTPKQIINKERGALNSRTVILKDYNNFLSQNTGEHMSMDMLV
jgi:hypothetical protein